MFVPSAILLLLCSTAHLTGVSPDEISATEEGVTEVDYTDDVRVMDEEDLGKAATYPCTCADGKCSCCSGKLLENFNITIRQRACTHLKFDPEELDLTIRLTFNNRELYKTQVNGKNPPPMCIPIPRLTGLRLCTRLNNLYFIGRNVHTCVSFEAQWRKETAFALNFDCIRLGANGVAIVKPEEGGGLPAVHKPIPDDDIEDYDENVTDRPTKNKKGKPKPKPE